MVTSSAVVGSSAMDEQLRVAGERHRDHHPLAHAARELVGIVVRPLRRVGDMDELQHLDGPVHRRAVRQLVMRAERLGDLLAHRVDGVERGHRLLEDDGDLLAADEAHRSGVERHEIAALPENPPGDDAAGRHRDQLQHGMGGDGLAAAGFADDAHRLAPPDADVDAVDRPHHAVIGAEMRLKSDDVEQGAAGRRGRGRHGGHRTRRGSSTSRNPSPTKLIASTARKIAEPAISAQCGAMSR